MALTSRWKSSDRLLRLPNKLLKATGQQNILIYPFDDGFFEQYGSFVDKIHRIEGSAVRGDPEYDSMLSLLTPATLVDIMLAEHNCNMTLTGSIEDTLYMRFDESLASEALEAVFKFYCSTVEPNGFWDVLDIIKSSNEFMYMADFFGVREEEAVVYVLRNCE